MNARWTLALAAGWAAWGLSVSAAAAELPELNIDLKETTVSGISSGAFMAVQMGVVHSASVRGVAATAGGPYLCALDSAYSPLGLTTAIGRCMQGDPTMPPSALALGRAEMDDMVRRTRNAAKWQNIDPVENLAKQAVWVFHGYNDGIVKMPVSQALINWYQAFTPASQVFHKDNLNAAHAQISAACASPAAASAPTSASGSSCNLCPVTGGKFINNCQDQPPKADDASYDAAGSALQMFYGPLKRTATEQLGSQPQAFSQTPYLKLYNGVTLRKPAEIAMGDTGYVYVPKDCQGGQQVCRLHIAFHGCMQSATTIGTSFVDGAGVNEWADANRIVVLYPQATPTNQEAVQASPTEPWKMLSYQLDQPLNPMGCWDWWGYNDSVMRSTYTPGGTYATSKGLQIAAVWRMAEKIAAKGKPGSFSPAPAAAAAPQLALLDQTAAQVLLRWSPVAGATAYQVYRGSADQPDQPAQAVGAATSQLYWADAALSPQSSYRYTVRALVQGQAGVESNAVSVSTSKPAPACDPYFSLAKNSTVDKYNLPTTAVCP